MNIKKLEDGTLLVPTRIEGGGMIGDTMLEIKTDHPEYEKYIERYENDVRVEKRFQERMRGTK